MFLSNPVLFLLVMLLRSCVLAGHPGHHWSNRRGHRGIKRTRQEGRDDYTLLSGLHVVSENLPGEGLAIYKLITKRSNESKEVSASRKGLHGSVHLCSLGGYDLVVVGDYKKVNYHDEIHIAGLQWMTQTSFSLKQVECSPMQKQELIRSIKSL